MKILASSDDYEAHYVHTIDSDYEDEESLEFDVYSNYGSLSCKVVPIVNEGEPYYYMIKDEGTQGELYKVDNNGNGKFVTSYTFDSYDEDFQSMNEYVKDVIDEMCYEIMSRMY